MINKIEIVVGFSCNNNCKFCSIGERNYNKGTDQVKKDIQKAAIEKPREINFTGGEPTIRKDITDLIKFTKGKVKNIRVTTNGRMFSGLDFTEKLTRAGLSGAIFSVHGVNARVHDYLTQVDGAFKQTTCGLKNLRDFTEDIDINVVINKLNYESLPELTEMLFTEYEIRSICFIYPDIDGNLLKNLWMVPSYNEIENFLHKALDVVRNYKKTAWSLNIPPCFFKGYEKYSSLYELKTKMFWPDMVTDLDKKRKEGKIKLGQCKGCKYNSVCHGVSKKYVELKGEEEIKPLEE